MKAAFIVFVLLGMYGSAEVFGFDPARIQVRQTVVMAPPVIFVPHTTMVPYQLVRTEVTPIVYPTPLRNLLFGRQRVTHVFSPQVQQ